VKLSAKVKPLTRQDTHSRLFSPNVLHANTLPGLAMPLAPSLGFSSLTERRTPLNGSAASFEGVLHVAYSLVNFCW